MGEVLGDRNFRRYFTAQFLYAAVQGTLRFAFIWLMVSATDWPAAEGLIAIVYGLPALLLSLPAGAWSDRVDRRRMFVLWTALASASMGTFSIIVWMGWANTAVIGAAAIVIGALAVINLPNLAAMAPELVPRRLLMNAIAIQNGTAQAANFLGVIVAGFVIGWFGNAGGFAFLALLSGLAALVMVGVRFPPKPSPEPSPAAVLGDPITAVTVGTPPQESIWTSVVAGARYGFRQDPLRTLLISTSIMSISFNVMMVSMPRVVSEVYGGGSQLAGAVVSSFGIGMLLGSLTVSSRTHLPHGTLLVWCLGVGLGVGQFLVGLAPSAPLAIGALVGWGIVAGMAMVSHRTLLQINTEPAMMGRVMGLQQVGFAGSAPLGAALQSVLAPALGAQRAMMTVGLLSVLIMVPMFARRPIRTLR